MTISRGYAALQAKVPLAPFTFERREPGPRDIHITIAYCGVCHSDLHQVRDEWGGALFPMVPGHEIVGTVTAVGTDVTKFTVGDQAGVGCLVDSCGHCANCMAHEEQYCLTGATWTYNSKDARGALTYGGYANDIVVDERFALTIPTGLDLARVAPLLCAGITTYSPLRHWHVGAGHVVGVVGLGGLGHMALKFAKAFGAHVVQFTTSPAKVADAQRLGADEVVLSNDRPSMTAQSNRFDFIIDTVSAPHDITQFLGLLKRNGTMTLVGVPESPPVVRPSVLIGARRSLAGSLIGGIAETQEMLEFCGANDIMSDIELIPIQSIETAYERMLRGDVKYRFVIDLATLGA
jgi:alcohol dehydrogenase (NADP+)